VSGSGSVAVWLAVAGWQWLGGWVTVWQWQWLGDSSGWVWQGVQLTWGGEWQWLGGSVAVAVWLGVTV
jgi:hypothetical protein